VRRVSLIYVNGHEIVMVWFHAVSDAAPTHHDCTGSMFRSGDQKKEQTQRSDGKLFSWFHEFRREKYSDAITRSDKSVAAAILLAAREDCGANRQRAPLTAVTDTAITPLPAAPSPLWASDVAGAKSRPEHRRLGRLSLRRLRTGYLRNWSS
jgi:hypothetical protein